MSNAASPLPAASASPREASLKTRLAQEARKAVLIAFYLWAVLASFRLYGAAVRDGNWWSYWSQGFAIINALILAKVILIGDLLRIGRGARGLRRIWFILTQAVSFGVLIVLFHVAEDVGRAAFEGEGFIAPTVKALSGPHLSANIALVIILFLMLIPFFAFRELIRALGADTVVAMLLAKGERSYDVVERS